MRTELIIYVWSSDKSHVVWWRHLKLPPLHKVSCVHAVVALSSECHEDCFWNTEELFIGILGYKTDLWKVCGSNTLSKNLFGYVPGGFSFLLHIVVLAINCFNLTWSSYLALSTAVARTLPHAASLDTTYILHVIFHWYTGSLQSQTLFE